MLSFINLSAQGFTRLLRLDCKCILHKIHPPRLQEKFIVGGMEVR